MTRFSYCVYPALQRALDEKGYSRESLADKVGISNSNVWWWLTGKNRRTIETITAILDAAGMTYEEAFGGKRNEM